ncbi:PREDICTED: uncharacterized protein LOC109207446 [Nicotiana attenuata]|uniref:uncharacterized protein LOC109207446 n=1 Tax=Nicotiana attenuata TaxID=49451 RepID=UPI0009058A69|nr:PREDICTED: uncharacterized protein LOC109207446 [Nicotiana attenuata]
MFLLAVPNEWAAEAFTKGLNLRSSDTSRKLKESLLEFQATTWTDVHNRYESKIRIEDDQVGFPSSAKIREKDRENQKMTTTDGLRGAGERNVRVTGSFLPQVIEIQVQSQYSGIVLALRNIKEARFPRPMRSVPEQRDPNSWCEYHGTKGHRTGDCRHLQEEVETLLKNGHLIEFLSDRAKNNYGRNRDNAEPSKAGEEPPHQTVNDLQINEVTFSAMKKTKVSITRSKRLWEDDITFTEEDTDGLLLPHNDALVISLNVLDFKIKCVLVDPRISANIIQWRVLEQTKLTGSIIPATKLLAGFNLASVTTRGEILLLTNPEGVMKTTLFEVVDGVMGYYIILGRPWLHEMKVVPSTYHQLLKFSTPEGIKHIRGDQPATRDECNLGL